LFYFVLILYTVFCFKKSVFTEVYRKYRSLPPDLQKFRKDCKEKCEGQKLKIVLSKKLFNCITAVLLQ